MDDDDQLDEATDLDAELEELADPDAPKGTPAPSRLVKWSRTTAMGAVMSGIALGLQEVFEAPQQNPVVIEVDADGLPETLPIEVYIDPDNPAGSRALVRRLGGKPPEV